MKACALLVNIFMLFVGLMLVITSFLEQQAIRAGQAFDSALRDIISVIVFICNVFVFGLPVFRTLTESRVSSHGKGLCRYVSARTYQTSLSPVLSRCCRAKQPTKCLLHYSVPGNT